MERFAITALELLKNALPTLGLEGDFDLEMSSPPDPTLGDFAFPCFKLSKLARKSPQILAQELTQTLRPLAPAQGLSVQAVGPYVNFTVDPTLATTALLQDILHGEYGALPAKTRGRWVLEYSSPNVAKPFQIYHLRPTALGAALARMGRLRGYDVISINHLGDWGTQYGKLAVALRIYADRLPAEPTIDDLVSIYVAFHKEVETRPELEDEARAAFLKLENGDPEITALWKKCVDISLREFHRIYARIGVSFDHIWGESYYKDLLAPLLERLKNEGLLIESEGAWVVPVTDAQGKELPPCILQKKDGATIYATRDVAAAIYRYDKFKFDRMTYIVGGEQKLHFQQVFGVLRKMGEPWVEKCEHIPTGIYRFNGGKMSTRKGAFVTLEEGLTLAKERVGELMRSRLGEAPADFDIESVSEAVAIGAVAFFDLSTDPARDVEFDLERVVDFEGETGPYLQYAHTRCLGIIRKAKVDSSLLKGDPEKLAKNLTHPAEIRLIKMLGQLPSQLERSLQQRKASPLAQYLIDVTKAFGTFYRECHVLGESPDVTQARLHLVEATRLVLAKGLGLLGIPTPDKM